MVPVSDKYLPIVTGVAVLGDHVLRLLFSDGTVGNVDFSAERWTRGTGAAQRPGILRPSGRRREGGTVSWPDGIDLAPSRCMSRP
jgi:hypothetical protein